VRLPRERQPAERQAEPGTPSRALARPLTEERFLEEAMSLDEGPCIRSPGRSAKG